MSDCNHHQGGVRPRRRRSLLECAASVLVIVSSSAWAGAGSADYLDAIEAETEKLALGATTPTEPAAPAGAGFSEGMDREQFAKELAAKYEGSFVFYNKLSPPAQEEIYQEYLKGSPYELVQQKIMAKFLKR